MKKFIFFLFLFFPILCLAQNKFVQTGQRGASPFKVKQVETARQSQSQAVQKTPQVQQRPVVQTNSFATQKQINQQNSVQREDSHKTLFNRPTNTHKHINPSFQRMDSANKIPFNKEQKPSVNNTNRPKPRPGNYQVIYWTNFLDTKNPKEQEWASKVLDTKNISLDGRGVQVAVLDSGIRQHSQFNGANIEILDITGQNDPLDFCGHGTAVAGIIVGQKGNDFKGIAPAVNLKSYKIADESGTTNNNYIIDALDSILEYNRQNPNARISIINISYGLEQDNYELKNKLAEAYSSGITIISATGNDGVQGLLYPAAYNFVFAAGSMDKNKQVSAFSNWGEGLDFILPGSGLKTLGINNDYVWVRGTSFSSAYLTGVAALATQAFKNKYNRLPSPQELYEVLQKISTKLPSVPYLKQGYGVPDASKIVSYI